MESMKTEYIKCQQCDGTGRIFFRPNAKVPYTDCDLCKGSGGYEGNILWIIQGSKIRDFRIGNNYTLRECASRFEIDASNLSKMERGAIKPDSRLLKYILT